MVRMRKAQLFSEDIIFAMVLVLFVFSMWLILRDRVITMVSASEDKRNVDEATSTALGQLLESGGFPTNWNQLYPANDTTVGSIGLVSDRNVLDSAKVARFISLAGGHLTSSLVALWHFDEGSGNYVYDSSGNGGTGTPAVALNWTTAGKFGTALQFSTSTYNYVIVNSSSSLNISGPLTIELWFNEPVILANTPWLISKNSGSSTLNSTNYAIWIGSSNNVFASIGNGTNYQNITSATIIQTNKWYHVALTANGTTNNNGVLNLYINGVLDNTTSQTMLPGPVNSNLYIGAVKNSMLFAFNGTIDEVAIYSRAKSASEIASDYTGEIATESDYTSIKRLMGLDRESYRFNFSVSYLNGTSIYLLNYTPSTTTYNASFAITNTTASIDRFALLNNTIVKVTLGVWIE